MSHPIVHVPQDVLPVAAQPFDSKALRKCLGQFATGVTVVTAQTPDGVCLGLTVNSFSTLSLEPPLVLWSLRLSSSLLPHFQNEGRFAINVLAASQASVSQRFASSTAIQKFEQTPHAINEEGFVLLQDASAYFECQTISAQDFGDHRLLIARVLRFSQSGQEPLIFFDGRYRALATPV